MAANAALVYRVLRAAERPDTDRIVRQVLLASRSLLENGRPNQYAVREREEASLQFLDRLGWTVPLPDGSVADISRLPVEVRLRD
jgi:hypothetical protein